MFKPSNMSTAQWIHSEWVHGPQPEDEYEDDDRDMLADEWDEYTTQDEAEALDNYERNQQSE